MGISRDVLWIRTEESEVRLVLLLLSELRILEMQMTVRAELLSTVAL